MQQIIEWSYWGETTLAVFGLAMCIQLYFFFNYFLRIANAKAATYPEPIKPVTVVVCARNEEKNLMDNVPLLMDQDHPNYEVVIVNDSSWDDTEAILKALQVSYPHIHIINLDEEKQNMQGKKFALTLGIKAAKHDTILLMDADCQPIGQSWVREMTAPVDSQKQMVLGFSGFKRYPGWLNKIIRFDALMIGLQYLGFAKAGNPYMGVGRNLCYRRELFFSVGGFKSHYSLSSGDDDLFVNQVANSRNTAVVFNPASQTISEPKKTWGSWFTQKRRHLTTAPYYKAVHKQMLGLWPLSYFLLIASFGACMVLKNGMLVVGGVLLLRYIIQLVILHKATSKLGVSRDLVWLAPVLEFYLHVLNTGLYLVNLVRKPQKWN
jgi:cellulose synthase/poly-beta-1,6-N-acetylglucosamine synthase-like glycosyltransferase